MKKGQNSFLKHLILSLSLILAGAVLYVLFEGNLFSIKILDTAVLTATNSIMQFIRNFVIEFFIALGAFVLLSYFIKKLTSKYTLFTTLVVMLLGIGYEVLQLTKVIPGTFDLLDIVVYLIASLLGILIIDYNSKK